jgi:cell division protein FtsW (lipid II flippase)
MQLAALFMTALSIALTLAPAVRIHTSGVELRWQHWIGFAVWLVGFGAVHRQADKWISDRDPYLLPVISLMTGWGLITLFRLDPAYGIRQTIWLAISLVGLIIGLRMQTLLPVLRRYKYIWLTLALTLAFLTFFFGTSPSESGPALWLTFGGIYLQPSEFLKIVLIIYLAAYLADSLPARFRLMQLLTPTLLVAGAALMILVVQRDLGTASLFIAMYTVIIFLASGKRRFLLISFLIIVAALIAGYFVFDVIEVRVEGWLNPWLDPNGRSYQIVQSIIAIANGGLFGRGIGLGSPGVVPVAQSDFIFPTIIEETGLFGAVAVVLLYAVLTLRGFLISLRASNQFQRYLAAGITTYLVSQALLIMGGTTRLLPLTGVTLPFFSYGGSSLVTAFFAALLLLIISHHTTDETSQVVQSKAYFIVGTVYLSALLAVGLVCAWWGFARADALLARNDNPRRFISDQYVQRGKILDRKNVIIAETVGESGNLERVLHFPTLSSVVGYSNASYGQGGLEASLDSILRGVEGNNPVTVFNNRLLNSQYPVGADIRLSLDTNLQLIADDLLKDKTGSIVMLNAQSGEVMVMATSPTFDSNALEENWETWKSDPTSPLLNRATQGQYPASNATAGLMLARLLADQRLPSFAPEQEWSTDIQNSLYCAQTPGSEAGWGELIISGCNRSFNMLEYYLGLDNKLDLYQELGLFSQPELSIADSISTETSKTAPKQEGRNLLVSPLQMAAAYAALSNGGKVVSPLLATAFSYNDDQWSLFSTDSTPTTLPGMDTAQSASILASTTLPGWSLVSTGLTESGKVNWFIAGTPVDWKGTPVVLVVALEDATTNLSIKIGTEMINAAVNTIN